MLQNTFDKKRVLIIRNAYSYDFGGGERMPVELAKSLQKINFEPIVVSRSKSVLHYAKANRVKSEKGWWWSFQDWSGYRLLFFPIYLLWQLVLTGHYAYLIRKHHIDTVHPQSRDDFIGATLAARLLRKPVIWTDHADLKYIYRNNVVWYKNPLGKIVYWLSKKSKRVIIVSHNELKEISHSLGHTAPQNYQVIYNGVGTEPVNAKPRSQSDHSAIIFAATSRLVSTKGIGELLDAFQHISQNRKDLRLWLIGTGPQEHAYKSHAKENEHIVFWGHRENPLDYVAQADVFVHPSYHEGFSVSLVEAAKLGLPIIACIVGGNPEIVTNQRNGLLVPPKDSGALANAMLELANSKELRKSFGAASSEKYRENFVWDVIVEEQYRELYE